jgi:hypothetical protein
MNKPTAYWPMTSAPREGMPPPIIVVRQGAAQVEIRAMWSNRSQAWVAADDPLNRTLYQVTGWRPLP